MVVRRNPCTPLKQKRLSGPPVISESWVCDRSRVSRKSLRRRPSRTGKEIAVPPCLLVSLAQLFGKANDVKGEKIMIRLAAVALLAFSASIFAQTTQLHSGSTVYIKPTGGYEQYLAAALQKKKVPVIIVTEQAKADFVILSTVSHESRRPGIVINNRATTNAGVNNSGNGGWNSGTNAGLGFPHGTVESHTAASISVVDPRTSQIIFAYSSGSYGLNQTETTAENFAKHFKKFIKKSEKR